MGRRFERVELPLKDAMRGWGLTAVDIDNDGWVDLAAIVETKSGARKFGSCATAAMGL